MNKLYEKLTPNFERATWAFFLLCLFSNLILFWFAQNGDNYQREFLSDFGRIIQQLIFFSLCFGLFSLFSKQGSKILVLAVPLLISTLVLTNLENPFSGESSPISIYNGIYFFLLIGSTFLWIKSSKMDFNHGLYFIPVMLIFFNFCQGGARFFAMAMLPIVSGPNVALTEVYSLPIFGYVSAMEFWALLYNILLQTLTFSSFLVIHQFQQEKEGLNWIRNYPKNIKFSTGLFTFFLLAFHIIALGIFISIHNGITLPSELATDTSASIFLFLDSLLRYSSLLALCIIIRFMLRAYFFQKGETTTIWIYLLNIPTLSWIALLVFLLLNFIRRKNSNTSSDNNVLDAEAISPENKENKKLFFPRKMIMGFQYGYLALSIIVMLQIPGQLSGNSGFSMEGARQFMDVMLLITLISFGMHYIIFKFENGIYWLLALQPVLHFVHWYFEFYSLGALVYGRIFMLLFLNYFELFPKTKMEQEAAPDDQNRIPITQTSST
jgi:hypothetical protein